MRQATYEGREALSRVHLASIRELCGPSYTPEHVAAWVGALAPSAYDHAQGDVAESPACHDLPGGTPLACVRMVKSLDSGNLSNK